MTTTNSRLIKTNETQARFDRNIVVRFGDYVESVFARINETDEAALARRFGAEFVFPADMTTRVFILR